MHLTLARACGFNSRRSWYAGRNCVMSAPELVEWEWSESAAGGEGKAERLALAKMKLAEAAGAWGKQTRRKSTEH